MTSDELTLANTRQIVVETHMEVIHLKEIVQELKDGKWASCAAHAEKIGSLQAELTEHKRDTAAAFAEMWQRIWWLVGLPLGAIVSVVVGVGVYVLTQNQ